MIRLIWWILWDLKPGKIGDGLSTGEVFGISILFGVSVSAVQGFASFEKHKGRISALMFGVV
ncbi:MAG: hypothetical protein K8S13_20570 [Desulfobacula sp.]|uniref:hypothetical protein n=1 Tax=Desulfobacula sp. TaxID=2593537 RepID=UPI0025B886D0|nr:hypothetical protein [Desulfobacula sp.]MCD4722228.1 hypothetical protein [Desulfobacula sp.]